MFALSFWGYDLGKRLVASATSTGPNGELSIAQISAAGFFSAIPMTAVSGAADSNSTVNRFTAWRKTNDLQLRLKE